MRVEKKSRWKAVLAVLCAVVLMVMSYLTLLPDGLWLPRLRWGVYAIDGAQMGLRESSAVLVTRTSQPAEGEMVAVRQAGEITLGYLDKLESGEAVVDIDGQSVTVDQGDILGTADYEVFALGAVIHALGGQPGRYFVWAADGLYVCLLCLWLATLPNRRRKRRREELIRLFEYYGAKYDHEEEGLDY